MSIEDSAVGRSLCAVYCVVSIIEIAYLVGRASMLAPASQSVAHAPTCPCAHAKCSGVHPSRLTASRLAARAIITRSTSAKPR